ncbi:pre-toxin TG domain-containing protein, partial [Lactiplantibacillus plantarum]
KKKSSKKHGKSNKKKSSKKHGKSSKKKSSKKHGKSNKKKSSKKHASKGSAVIATLSRKTGISKGIISLLTDLVGYNDIYTMITGKDAATGKKRSRLVGAAWTALNFVPVSKVAKLAKAAKVLATAKKAEKVAKNGGRIKRAARATKLATKRAAEKLAKRKPAKKTAKKAAEKARKAKKVKTAKKAKHQQAKLKKTSHGTKHKTTKKQQKRYNKKKAAGKARKASYARKKGGTKKKPGKRKGSKAKTAKRKAKDRANKTEKVSGIALGKLDKKLIARLEKNGVKISKEDVIRIKELPDEKKIVWLEKGNTSAGFEHILIEHGEQFTKQGISKSELPDFLMTVLEKGKIIGYQGKGKGRPIYEVIYNGKKYRAAITVGKNGFIVGANPVSIK